MIPIDSWQRPGNYSIMDRVDETFQSMSEKFRFGLASTALLATVKSDRKLWLPYLNSQDSVYNPYTDLLYYPKLNIVLNRNGDYAILTRRVIEH